MPVVPVLPVVPVVLVVPVVWGGCAPARPVLQLSVPLRPAAVWWTQCHIRRHGGGVARDDVPRPPRMQALCQPLAYKMSTLARHTVFPMAAVASMACRPPPLDRLFW